MNLDLETDDAEFSINENYAESYNKWRQKEELQKLKDRYQTDDVDQLEQSSSDSETEDEDAEELTPAFEKNFLTALGCLKKKDPKIYDGNHVFFEGPSEGNVKKPKDKGDKPMYLRDFERKVILENNGELNDEDDNEEVERPASPTYVENQKKLKESFKNLVEDSSDEDETLLVHKEKTKQEKENEETDYLKWLKGQGNLKEDDVNEDMKYLQNYWTDPSLNSDEKFLRDFIVNKRYLNKEEDDADDDDGKIEENLAELSEEEEAMEKIEEFEYKYNFRFEEPDPEFIKRYPRTMTNVLRRKDNKRSVKREEIKERKAQEKNKKKEDLKLIKIFKRNEIMEKIEKIKEITGNKDLGINDDDLEGDFDPEGHDKKMKELFDEEFYGGVEADQKPTFTDDEDANVENWDDWTGHNGSEAPDCEDPNFIMDADYDPNAASTSGEKKSKKSSKFSQAVNKSKPVFDPGSKSFEEYFDEYYKLDYEDIIGDMPVRFKYRKVQENDFGLSVDEVLNAKEKDLNKWCSVKKMCQYRTDEEELYDVKAFKQKSQQTSRKRKLIPSLFENSSKTVKEDSNAEKADVETVPENDSEPDQKRQKANSESAAKDDELKKAAKSNDGVDNTNTSKKKKNSRKNKKQEKSSKSSENNQSTVTDNRLKAYGLNPKKFKNKLKYKKQK